MKSTAPVLIRPSRSAAPGRISAPPIRAASQDTRGWDLVCFSHLRWDFVFQRPQHLMTRFASRRRVFFIEEPVLGKGPRPMMDVSRRDHGLHVVTPHLPDTMPERELAASLKRLIDELFIAKRITEFVSWYYTPMALGATRHLKPHAIVYDCMDELSAFNHAPRALIDYEHELLNRAHVVFTGGQSLYEAKRHRHSNIHPFPSSIDTHHFYQARSCKSEPADQALLPHPRLGFAGVIDERMDLKLLGDAAALRPEWQFVVIGPIVKIDRTSLPALPNIHYLGQKAYADLPAYMSGWDVAMLPFARNESTRFISPTKTPEYLAAGRPVISTSIQDVVRPYGELGLVRVADTPEDWVAAADAAMQQNREEKQRRQKADAFLRPLSWEKTWSEMSALVQKAVDNARHRSAFALAS